VLKVVFSRGGKGLVLICVALGYIALVALTSSPPLKGGALGCKIALSTRRAIVTVIIVLMMKRKLCVTFLSSSKLL